MVQRLMVFGFCFTVECFGFAIHRSIVPFEYLHATHGEGKLGRSRPSDQGLNFKSQDLRFGV
jgi:hypothetical protein